MGKTVRTLSPGELTRAADNLLALVEQSGFHPDALVGIETGGLRVLEALSYPPRVVLSCRMVRPSTERKKSKPAERVLRTLPYAIGDRLRQAEDWWGARGQVVVPEPTEELLRGVRHVVDVVTAERLRALLVVDDAVDSGGTLACVMGALRAALPDDVRLASAVLTRTRPTDQTALVPDFSLHALVLLRYPWSHDYRASA